MNIINRTLTLVLNKNWLPIGTRTIGKAIVDLASDVSKYLALNIEYEKDKNGNYTTYPTQYLHSNHINTRVITSIYS